MYSSKYNFSKTTIINSVSVRKSESMISTEPSQLSLVSGASVLSHVARQPHACSWTRASAMLVHKVMDKTAGLKEVSRCHTRDESEKSVACKQTSEGSTLALKPRADVNRSPKEGYQWPHKNDFVL